MATRLVDYEGDGQHTHRQQIPFITWALLVGLVLLAATIGILGGWLAGRAALSDSRNQLTRAQVASLRNTACSLLIPVRPGQTAAVNAFRARRFPTGAHRTVPLCPPVTFHRTAKPQPTPAAPATNDRGSGSPVAPRPASTITKTPAPIIIHATKTIRPPKPQQHPTRTPTTTPDPVAKCLKNLLKIHRCR